MDANIIQRLEYLPDARPREPQIGSALVEFVGGPRSGERELLSDTPTVIQAEGGMYRRSVRCADDGALRYVFDEDPLQIAHERWLRPC
jgi:hypothetical protein